MCDYRTIDFVGLCGVMTRLRRKCVARFSSRNKRVLKSYSASAQNFCALPRIQALRSKWSQNAPINLEWDHPMTYPTGIKSSNLSNSGNIHLPTSSPPAAHAAAPQLSSRALSADKVWAPTVPGSMINFIKLAPGFPAVAQRTTRQQEAVTASSPTSGQARSSTATSMSTSGEKTNTERPTNKRQWHELGSASTAAPAKRSRLGTPDEPSMVASQPSLTKHSVNSSVGPAIPHIGIAMASLTNSLVALASTEKNPQSAQASRHSAPLPGPQNFQLELSADNAFRDVLSNFKSTGEISMEDINSLINFSNTDYPLKHSRLIHLIEFVDALLSEMSAGRALGGIFYVGALSRTIFDRFFPSPARAGLRKAMSRSGCDR